ncbi:hypothetical protein NA57DRAFT_56497 [Rhizodiscina lignyota]|uniref:Extracellular membrane protein CFEM domain-containing protein n=1 Tax=Rhizodiscina lignyota TaxID=1504668 RepID=A0A9P4MAL4_9PEZI|nr:hypothetical protein NA57DRAFT_56497 [Rhizodiscina lignyota]
MISASAFSYTIFIHFSLSLAQTALDPTKCVKGSGVTALPQCDYLYDTVDKFNSTAPGSAFVNCFCNQKLFNSVFDCESEQRLCFGNGDLDNTAEQFVDTWHSACDKKITFTPTTPSVSSITASYNVQYCTTMFAACASASIANQACESSFTIPSERVSCFCQAPLLANEYTCAYLGNVSCIQTEAALSRIPGYSICPNFESVVGGLANATATTTASGGSSSSIKSSSQVSGSSIASITKPALPGSSSSTASPSPTQQGQATSSGISHYAFLIACVAVLLKI